MARTADCTRAQGRSRLQQAEAFVLAADLVLSDDTDTATPSVAAALGVLAGIAASDAAKDIARLLASKDESHYGVTLVDRTKPGTSSATRSGWSSRARDVLAG